MGILGAIVRCAEGRGRPHGVCVRIKKGWATMHLTSCRVIVLERFSSHIPISRDAPTPFALS